MNEPRSSTVVDFDIRSVYSPALVAGFTIRPARSEGS